MVHSPLCGEYARISESCVNIGASTAGTAATFEIGAQPTTLIIYDLGEHSHPDLVTRSKRKILTNRPL